MLVEQLYNKIYSENENVFGDGKPEKIVEEIPKLLESGSVLDIGAGEGRNSIFLAERGFKVTANDISDVGIEKINKLAKEKGLNIQAEVNDLKSLTLNNNFDVLICTFVLHHFDRQNALALIKQIQNHTNPGGVNALTAFTEDGDFYRHSPQTKNFYLKPNELKELYNGWEVLEYHEKESKAFKKNPDGSPMTNVAVKILVRKTAAANI